MKAIIIIITLCITNKMFAQNTVALNDIHTYAYVNGVRLDSVQSEYAEFSWRSLKRIALDYGQDAGKDKESILTDENGKDLTFDSRSEVKLLNFFYYNHWQLVQYYSNSAGLYYYILKKIEQSLN